MVAPPTLLGQLQYFDSGKQSPRLGRKLYLHSLGRLTAISTPDSVADPDLRCGIIGDISAGVETAFPKTMLVSTPPPHNWENP
jgi:hypothetical protein